MISIVVPIFNGEKYIKDCITSILLQTYVDWELLLIDNASDDDSLRLCKEYAVKDDRIQVLHQHRNMGVSVARNLGMEKARGEFVTFVDIDDWIEDDYLERLFAFQNQNKADMVICGYQKAFDKDRQVLQDRLKKQKENQACIENSIQKTEWFKAYNVEEYLEHYFLEGNTHCWGVLYQRQLLEGVQFPKGITIGEDMLFLLEIAQKTKNLVITDYKGYHYYINEAGAMKKKFTLSYMDQIVCWERALQKIEKNYPKLRVKVISIILVSILLVVGKISELTTDERKEYEMVEKKCYDTFLKYIKVKGVQKFLPKGYPIKVFIYQHFPLVYIKLYGSLRKA
ncbi:MAG: glycosyltransferase [Lachnospiraceae bacterium]|nr:glycosyltransferase [Lachnospiraceae bacterium]